jgi:hypothetical protein
LFKTFQPFESHTNKEFTKLNDFEKDAEFKEGTFKLFIETFGHKYSSKNNLKRGYSRFLKRMNLDEKKLEEILKFTPKKHWIEEELIQKIRFCDERIKELEKIVSEKFVIFFKIRTMKNEELEAKCQQIENVESNEMLKKKFGEEWNQ